MARRAELSALTLDAATGADITAPPRAALAVRLAARTRAVNTDRASLTWALISAGGWLASAEHAELAHRAARLTGRGSRRAAPLLTERELKWAVRRPLAGGRDAGGPVADVAPTTAPLTGQDAGALLAEVARCAVPLLFTGRVIKAAGAGLGVTELIPRAVAVSSAELRR